MKLSHQAFSVYIPDEVGKRAHTRADVFTLAHSNGELGWSGSATIDSDSIGLLATKSDAQRALASALRALADKVESDE